MSDGASYNKYIVLGPCQHEWVVTCVFSKIYAYHYSNEVKKISFNQTTYRPILVSKYPLVSDDAVLLLPLFHI